MMCKQLNGPFVNPSTLNFRPEHDSIDGGVGEIQDHVLAMKFFLPVILYLTQIFDGIK